MDSSTHGTFRAFIKEKKEKERERKTHKEIKYLTIMLKTKMTTKFFVHKSETLVF